MSKKVLIVDDMKSERDLISSYLESAGYFVTTAENGEQALEMAKRDQPDIIVTDLVMPQITGLELCRLLKKEAATAAIPIVACTTKDRQVDQTWAKKQGVNAYVVKPCSKEELINAVQSALLNAVPSVSL
jgi:twitching motility two-component system response regulator PilH